MLDTFLADLRRRGVVFALRGNRLTVRPWRVLTPHEAKTVQANRPALKDLIRAEGQPPATETATVTEVCRWCMRACVGRDHPAFAVLHDSDPSEIERRDLAATKEMLRQMRYGNPY